MLAPEPFPTLWVLLAKTETGSINQSIKHNATFHHGHAELSRGFPAELLVEYILFHQEQSQIDESSPNKYFHDFTCEFWCPAKILAFLMIKWSLSQQPLDRISPKKFRSPLSSFPFDSDGDRMSDKWLMKLLSLIVRSRKWTLKLNYTSTVCHLWLDDESLNLRSVNYHEVKAHTHTSKVLPTQQQQP
jgi:hypothetical protein